MERIANYSHIGYGEKIPEKSLPSWDRISSIALHALYKGSFIALGAGLGVCAAVVLTLNPITGALVGAGAFLSLQILAKAINRVFHRIYSDRFCSELSSLTLEKNKADGPLIGEYSPCDLIVLNSAKEIFEKKLELIDIAEESIECSFNFAGGIPFNQWLERLDNRFKERPNLKVHLMISSDLLTEDNRQKLRELKKNPSFHYLITDRHLSLEDGLRTEENHVKMMVVDEKFFISGGSGVGEPFIRDSVPPGYSPETFGDKVMYYAYRDTDLLGKGDLAKTIRSQFFNLYQIWLVRTGKKAKEKEGSYFAVDSSKTHFKCFEEDERVRKNARTKLLVSGPEHRINNPITTEYQRLISGAQKTVTISNLYFNPAQRLKKALEKKKREGIQITGYFNGTTLAKKKLSIADFCSTVTEHFMTCPCRSNYNGAFNEVYEYVKPRVGKHKKVAVINQTAIIGSYNLGTKSDENDYEIAFIIENKGVSDDLLKGIKEDETDCKLYQRKPYSINIINSVGGLISNYFLKGVLL